MPWLLYSQERSPHYPLDRRLGGPQSQSGCSGEEKNIGELVGRYICSLSLNYLTDGCHGTNWHSCTILIF